MKQYLRAITLALFVLLLVLWAADVIFDYDTLEFRYAVLFGIVLVQAEQLKGK